MKGIQIRNFAPTRTDFFARSVSPYLGQWEGEERFLPLLLSYADRGGGGGSVGYDCGNLNADKSKIPPPFSQALSKEKEKTRENFFKSRGRGGVGGRGRKKTWTCTSTTFPPAHLLDLISAAFGHHHPQSAPFVVLKEEEEGKKLQSFRQSHYSRTKARTGQPANPFLLFCPLEGW